MLPANGDHSVPSQAARPAAGPPATRENEPPASSKGRAGPAPSGSYDAIEVMPDRPGPMPVQDTPSHAPIGVGAPVEVVNPWPNAQRSGGSGPAPSGSCTFTERGCCSRM